MSSSRSYTQRNSHAGNMAPRQIVAQRCSTGWCSRDAQYQLQSTLLCCSTHPLPPAMSGIATCTVTAAGMLRRDAGSQSAGAACSRAMHVLAAGARATRPFGRSRGAACVLLSPSCAPGGDVCGGRGGYSHARARRLCGDAAAARPAAPGDVGGDPDPASPVGATPRGDTPKLRPSMLGRRMPNDSRRPSRGAGAPPPAPPAGTCQPACAARDGLPPEPLARGEGALNEPDRPIHSSTAWP
jgi:hypothetical protein